MDTSLYKELNLLEVVKKNKLNASLRRDTMLEKELEKIIKDTNGNDKYLGALMNVHDGIRINVNTNIVKGLKSLERALLPPQLTIVLDMFN